LLFIGMMLSVRSPLGNLLVLGGLALFGATVFFQLVNLPVEFNASARAKVQLVQLGIVSPQEMVYVNRVLDAAALTYVAATLQAVLTLLYYIFRFSDRR
jgi:Zn-dependent membrane protease YugP